MKPKENTCEWWIKRIREPSIRQEIMAEDYEQYKDRVVDSLRSAINWCTTTEKAGGARSKYLDKQGIELLDQPVEDSIGVPEGKYYVTNPNIYEANGEFLQLMKSLKATEGGDCNPIGTSKYYEFEKGGSVVYAYNYNLPKDIPEVPYEQFKAYVLEVTGEKVVDSVVSVLPEEYQISGRGHQTDEFRRLLRIAVGNHDMLGGSAWYSIRNGEVDAHSEDTNPELPIISYIDWKRILEGKSVKEEVPAVVEKYKVGDWVIPIVDVRVPEYELGMASLDKGKTYEVTSMGTGDSMQLGNGRSNWILCKDVRPATQSEIDSVSTPKAKSVDKIEVGLWVTILNNGCTCSNALGNVLQNYKAYKVKEVGWSSCYKWSYRLENVPKGVTGIAGDPDVAKYIRLATAAAEIAKATQSKEKVSDKASEEKCLWKVGDKFTHYTTKSEHTILSIETDNVTVSTSNRPTTYSIKETNDFREKGYWIPKPTTPEPWSAITTDGVKVYGKDRIWVTTVDHPRRLITECDAVSQKTEMNGDGTLTGSKYPMFSSKEAADRYIAEHTGKKKSWKEGDILPEEWLNVQRYYVNKKKYPTTGGFCDDRAIGKVDSDGYAHIKGSANYYQLGPKSEYPTYKTQVEGKQVTSTNQTSSSINNNQTTKQSKTSYEKDNNNYYSNTDNWISSSKEEHICTKSKSTSNKCIDISANTESIIISKGRNSTAICDPGQPEYIV